MAESHRSSANERGVHERNPALHELKGSFEGFSLYFR